MLHRDVVRVLKCVMNDCCNYAHDCAFVVQHAVEAAVAEYVSRCAKACANMALSISPEDVKKAVFEDDELNSIHKEAVNLATRVFYAEAVRVRLYVCFVWVCFAWVLSLSSLMQSLLRTVVVAHDTS